MYRARVWLSVVWLVACANGPAKDGNGSAGAGASAGAPAQLDSGQAGSMAGSASAGAPATDAGKDVGGDDEPDAAQPLSDAATDGGASTDAAQAADAATTPPGMGTYESLVVDGNAVSVYLPMFADTTSAVPVVLSLHGLSIPAIAMADITGLPALADKEGFIAVFPAGSGGTWNTQGSQCGLGAFAGNAFDDGAYMEHILDAVEKLHPIDRTRVFASGFSMGGYASNALACSKPGLFRAVAPASGGFPLGPCAAGVVPVMIFHGTSDGTIAHDCGVKARAAWVAHNRCSLEVDKKPVMGGTCEWSKGCPEHGQVVFCSFEGMGHGWAGSLNPFAFGGTQFESATSLMWSFFKGYL